MTFREGREVSLNIPLCQTSFWPYLFLQTGAYRACFLLLGLQDELSSRTRLPYAYATL